MTYTPLFDRVLLKPISSEQDIGGIIIPDTSSNLKKGLVISAGNGKPGMTMTIKEGDTILFRQDDAIGITLDGEMFLILNESNAWLNCKS